MKKKVYEVPVTWMMSGTYHVRASSPEAAKEAVFDAPLPKDGDYVDDSFSVDEDDVREVNFDSVDVIETDEEEEEEEKEEFEIESDEEEDKGISLAAPFEKLTEEGIISLENFSCCGSCGCAEIEEKIKEDSRQFTGFCFYHAQADESRKNGNEFYLNYGTTITTIEAVEEEIHEFAAKVGQRIVQVLKDFGIETEWNGNSNQKIKVLQ